MSGDVCRLESNDSFSVMNQVTSVGYKNDSFSGLVTRNSHNVAVPMPQPAAQNVSQTRTPMTSPATPTHSSVPSTSAIAQTALPAAQFASVPVFQTAPSAPATESIIETAREKLQGTDQDSIAFRLLNALLTHAPTVEGVRVIAEDIVDASAELDGLIRLADFYKTGLILPSKPHSASDNSFIASLINIRYR
jgi:hypothetical protein